MMDAINAEDIADFPDANLAEALQRLPGVALDRDNGEGRGITVRGLGSDFTRVRLNGLETLSTAAASDSGTSPNRGRGFDFNVFASDLFTSLEVTKTAAASQDEGSLGATVDLATGKPLDYKGTKLALSMEDAYYENGGTHNPRVAALVAGPMVRQHRRRLVFGRLQRTYFRGRPLQAAGRSVRLRLTAVRRLRARS
jgi:TonB-dependent receptor